VPSNHEIADVRDAQRGPGPDQRPGEPEVLGVRRHHFVRGTQRQAAEDDVHALGRRLRQGNVSRVDLDLGCEQRTYAFAPLEHRVEVGSPAAAVLRLPCPQLGHRRERRACEWSEGPGIQICVFAQHGKARALVGPAHSISNSTGA
jgi:hypothetical protein